MRLKLLKPFHGIPAGEECNIDDIEGKALVTGETAEEIKSDGKKSDTDADLDARIAKHVASQYDSDPVRKIFSRIEVKHPAAKTPGAVFGGNRAAFWAGVAELGDHGQFADVKRLPETNVFRKYCEALVARHVEVEGKSLTDAQVVAVDLAGGVLVPTEFSAMVLDNAFREDEILKRVRRIPMGSQVIKIPSRFISTRATAAGRHGGLQGYQIDESATKTPSRVSNFREVELKLNEIAVTCPISNLLIRFSPISIESIVAAVALDELNFMLQDMIFRGSGTGEALGFVNALNPSLVTVTRDTAGQVRSADIRAMWARRFGPRTGEYVWLCEQTVEPELDQLAWMPREGGTAAVAVKPEVSYDNNGVMRIKGLPVIATEFAAALGTSGDFALVNLREYLFGVPSNDPIEYAISGHVRFLTNEQVLRWTTLYDGRPWWTSAITPRSGAATRSPFLVLS